MATIKVSKGVEELLGALKMQYPELAEDEIVERALLEYHRQERRHRIQAWEEGLPTIQLSEEELDSLDEALAEAEEGKTQIMSVEELLDEVTRD